MTLSLCFISRDTSKVTMVLSLFRGAYITLFICAHESPSVQHQILQLFFAAATHSSTHELSFLRGPSKYVLGC